jgi:hypothetical protein
MVSLYLWGCATFRGMSSFGSLNWIIFWTATTRPHKYCIPPGRPLRWNLCLDHQAKKFTQILRPNHSFSST